MAKRRILDCARDPETGWVWVCFGGSDEMGWQWAAITTHQGASYTMEVENHTGHGSFVRAIAAGLVDLRAEEAAQPGHTTIYAAWRLSSADDLWQLVQLGGGGRLIGVVRPEYTALHKPLPTWYAAGVSAVSDDVAGWTAVGLAGPEEAKLLVERKTRERTKDLLLLIVEVADV